MHHGIVGGVEGFAAVAVGEHGDLAVVLVAHHAAVAVFAGNLAPGPVEGVAVAVAAGMTEGAHVSVLFQPAQLDVVRDIAPEQITAYAVPGRSLGPKHVWIGIQPADGGVAEFVLGERRIEHEHIRLGIARGRFASPIAGCALGGG